MRDPQRPPREPETSESQGLFCADTALRRLEFDFVLERIERDDLSAVAQPIIELDTGRTIAFEGLVRWPTGNSPSRAAELFDAARTHGLTDRLERAARNAVLRGARSIGAGTKLFINCAPSIVSDARFAWELDHDVRTAGLTPERVVVELTEQAEHEESSLERGVEVLRRRGFEIALDDFGVGASGFDRLMRVQPDWIKIDRSLIRDLDTDAPRARLIDAVARFCCETGVRVVAEGIETRSELRRLIGGGIGYGQGFLLGRPGVIASVPRAVAA